MVQIEISSLLQSLILWLAKVKPSSHIICCNLNQWVVFATKGNFAILYKGINELHSYKKFGGTMKRLV